MAQRAPHRYSGRNPSSRKAARDGRCGGSGVDGSWIFRRLVIAVFSINTKPASRVDVSEYFCLK
jgi:hypothetical protein